MAVNRRVTTPNRTSAEWKGKRRHALNSDCRIPSPPTEGWSSEEADSKLEAIECLVEQLRKEVPKAEVKCRPSATRIFDLGPSFCDDGREPWE